MRKTSSLFTLTILTVTAMVLLQSACGHPTLLTSMTVTPTGATVVGVGSGAQVQFTAFGTFTHPAETRDITTQVNWTTDIPQVATVQNGLVTTTGLACGVTNVTATATRELIGAGTSNSLITATATFTVADPNNDNCPQPQ